MAAGAGVSNERDLVGHGSFRLGCVPIRGGRTSDLRGARDHHIGDWARHTAASRLVSIACWTSAMPYGDCSGSRGGHSAMPTSPATKSIALNYRVRMPTQRHAARPAMFEQRPF